MKKSIQFALLIAVSMALSICPLASGAAKAKGKLDPNTARVIDADVREAYETVLNQYKTAYYFWYDTFADGEVPPENVKAADLKLKEAEAKLDAGVFDLSRKLIAEAAALLAVRKKSYEQFPYEPPTPLTRQDASKVHKAKAADYTVLDRYGVLMNDIGPSIWGYGDDGEYYFVMTFYNYHARGKIITPVVVEVMSTADPQKRYVYLLNQETKVTQTAGSVVYECVDGEKLFRQTVTDDPVGGGTHVLAEGKFPARPGKAPAITFAIRTTPSFSYWYNQNLGAALMYPGVVLAGFEQPGPASGTITMGDRTVRLNRAAGAVTEVCMISGAPGTKYDEYRSTMTKYGNEWYIAVHTDQVDAMFISYGKFRDAGIWYKGKYIIPTEYKLIPGIANQTLTLVAKTKEYGDLVLDFTMKLHDPVYTERVATVGGTFDGQALTGGGAWFEHCFKGSPDGIKAVQEKPELVDPM